MPRNRTLVTVRGGTEGKYTEHELWSPYAIGSNPQLGPNIIYEPLAFYSAFADKKILWLAESYEYSADFKELTVKTRPGINWSDGKPFTAEDVAYTFNTLNELGAKVKWGADVQQVAGGRRRRPTPTPSSVNFKVPAPRFFDLMLPTSTTSACYIVPKHIFEGQDWTTLHALRPRQGLAGHDRPVEGRLRLARRRRSSTAATTGGASRAGVGKLPKVERIICLPGHGRAADWRRR